MTLPVSLSVGFGSALGGFSRFYADTFLLSIASANVYTSLFLINVFGSFLIGFFLIRPQVASDEGAKLNWYFWGVGFCGGFTTFASFVFVLSKGIFEANVLAMALYASLSIITALIALAFGLIVGQKRLKRYNLGSGGSE